jgi:Zn-dependent metalloprotease
MAACRCAAQCIVPPHILRHMLKSKDARVREAALRTLLTTAHLRGERTVLQQGGFIANAAGEKSRTVFDCGHAESTDSARIKRSEGGPKVADRSVNAAYDGLGYTYDFWRAVFSRNSIDDRGMRLDGYVHYGKAYNNAYWNGRQMIFGDGDGVLFTDFAGSIDVIAHELGHGITEYTANLEYHDQPGALNESMSDVFGSMVKQWHLKQTAKAADWLIGAQIFTPKLKGDALRSMKAPGTAYDNPDMGKDPQPAHMKDYAMLPDTAEGDWGGVHVNSGIPNHAFYLLAVALGGHSWEVAGKIWFEALQQSNAQADFTAFAKKTHAVAVAAHGPSSHEASNVELAWNQVGIAIAPSSRQRARSPAASRAKPGSRV